MIYYTKLTKSRGQWWDARRNQVSVGHRMAEIGTSLQLVNRDIVKFPTNAPKGIAIEKPNKKSGE